MDNLSIIVVFFTKIVNLVRPVSNFCPRHVRGVLQIIEQQGEDGRKGHGLQKSYPLGIQSPEGLVLHWKNQSASCKAMRGYHGVNHYHAHEGLASEHCLTFESSWEDPLPPRARGLYPNNPQSMDFLYGLCNDKTPPLWNKYYLRYKNVLDHTATYSPPPHECRIAHSMELGFGKMQCSFPLTSPDFPDLDRSNAVWDGPQ